MSQRAVGGPVLRGISSDASPEEVAAIVAAIAECSRFGVPVAADDTLHEWVHTARIASRRAGLQRGPWRLSGRVGRRNRA